MEKYVKTINISRQNGGRSDSGFIKTLISKLQNQISTFPSSLGQSRSLSSVKITMSLTSYANLDNFSFHIFKF